MLEAYRYVALLVFWFAIVSTYAYDSITSAASNTSWPSYSPGSGTSTCPSRTINYITHSLPQQCLKTGWSEGITTVTAEGRPLPTPACYNETSLVPTSTTRTQNDTSSQSTAAQITDSVKATVTPAAASPVQSDHVRSAQVHQSPSGYTDPRPIAAVEPESDTDSPLDNANFLSFEDWKKQNLAKAGQSAETLGNKRPGSQGQEDRRRPGNINNALDSLGEDTEIELDFGGFVSSSSGEESTKTDRAGAVSRDSSGEDEDGKQESTFQGAASRSKDAGKTCKERFNYASFDCAATVLKTNPQCKGSSSVLVENKDSYMLNECSANNKFFIVELCGDILVDTIVLANFEFFSSMFRTFRVSVSDRYPVKLDKWKELGVFEARNSRDVQPFLVENPLIWARYLRIEFLTHYGNEYYCPVSLLRVHGTTMMEEFKHQEEAARGEEEDYEEDPVETETKIVEIVSGRITGQNVTDLEQQHEMNNTIIVQEHKIQPAAAMHSSASSNLVGDQETAQRPSDQEASESADGEIECEEEYSLSTTVILPFNATEYVCYQIEREMMQASEEYSEESDPRPASSDEVSSAPGSQQEDSVHQNSSVPALSAGSTTSNVTNSVISTASTMASTPVAEPKVSAPTSNSTVSRASDQTTNEQGKTPSSATTPAHSNPTTQENFFKSIHKRLQLLEANSTLSLQYIEDQSRILRDAFTKVEKRQLAKTTTFLENLNSTVLNELRGFRQQYDQIWQSTVIELETQREQSHREVVAISARLSILADEVIFQKRMSIVQSVLILLCLGLVIFSRGAASSYLELPLVQSMVSKSQRTLRHSFESPSESPPSTRPTSSRQWGNRFGRYGGHSRDHSEDSVQDGTRSLIIEYSPPTPVSDAGQSDASSSGRRSPSPTPSESPEKRVASRAPVSNGTPPRRPARSKKHSLSWPESDFADSGLLRPDSLSERPRAAPHA